MAAKPFLVDIDFSKNQALNMKLQNLATNPSLSAGDGGFTYWNTTDNKIYTWNGSGWFGGGGGDMLLASIQSVTGLKTFDTSKLAMLANGNTGVTTFANLNASVINYIQSFPAKTGTFAMLSDVPTVTPAALTKTDDTNITLTLGGTPATSLLQAVSFTLGWIGTLADARIASSANWNTAFTNRINSLTVSGSSGAATLVSNVLNIPTYTIAGLGGAPNTPSFITAVAEAGLPNEFALASLATGLLRNTTTTGIPTIATDSQVTAHLLTGYVSGAGTLAATDTILQAFNKLNGNIQLLTGAIVYQGLWNASTNTTPTLVNGTGTKGWMYKVSVAGTTNIDGNNYWVVGDMIVFNGTVWDRIEGSATEVSSVFGRVGSVVGAAADYSGVAMTGITSLNGLVITANTGVITTGTWNASTIAAIYGGTGQSTYAIGDLLAGAASNTLAKIAAVAVGSVLISNGVGAAPTWSTTPIFATATVNTNTTQGATTAFVVAEIASRIPATGASGNFVRKYSGTIVTNGVVTSVAIPQATHGLNTSGDYIIQVKTLAGVQVEADVSCDAATGIVTVAFNVAPAASTYKIVIIG